MRRTVYKEEDLERGARRRDLAEQVTEIAVRAYTEPEGWQPRGRRRRERVPWPHGALVLLAVPVPGSEDLWFGVWCRLLPVKAQWGLFYPDDTPGDVVAAIQAFARSRGIPERLVEHQTLFLDRFFRLSYRRGYRLPVVGWRLPGDLALLAAGWEPVGDGYELIIRTQPDLQRRRKGGKPLPKLRNRRIENPHGPRIRVSPTDRGRALMAYTPQWEPDRRDRIPEGEAEPRPRYHYEGRFVDLAAFSFGACGEEYDTLEDAAGAFEVGIPSMPAGTDLETALVGALARCEVAVRLYEKLLAEHAVRAPVGLAPHQVHSPSSYARAYLEEATGDPPLRRWPHFPREVLGNVMATYRGGENLIGAIPPTDLPFPVVSLDFAGGHPTVASLSGAWELFRARAVEIRQEDPEALHAFVSDVVRRLRAWCRGLSTKLPLDGADFARLLWTTVDVEPAGEILPHLRRSRSGKAWRLHVGPLTSPKPIPFVLADVVRAALDGERVPRIISGFRLVPRGRVRGRSVRLPDGTEVAPGEDLILALATMRRRVALRPDLGWGERERLAGWAKSVANSMVSGLPAQIIRREVRRGTARQHAWGPDGSHRVQKVRATEEPGPWFMPAIAAGVTAGQRLLTYLARALVEELGGFVYYQATDSLAVATREASFVPLPGGRERNERGEEGIRALSFAEIEWVQEKMDAFNVYPEDVQPYDHVWVGAPEYRDPLGRQARGRRRTGYPGRVRRPGFLKLEPENFPEGPAWGRRQLHMLAVSPLRAFPYALNRSGPYLTLDPEPVVHDDNRLLDVEVLDPSRQSLGQLLPPPRADKDWIEDAARFVLRGRLGLDAPEPPWFDDPALRPIPLTLPGECRDQRGRDRRPWTTVVVARPDPIYGPRRDDGSRVLPAATWHEEFDWRKASWFDFNTGEPLAMGIRTVGRGAGERYAGPIRVQSYREVIGWHFSRVLDHVLGPDGLPAGPRTIGVLRPAPTEAYRIRLIGKETVLLDRVGATMDPVYADYTDEAAGREWALEVLRDHGAPTVAATTEFPARSVRRFLRTGRPRRTRWGPYVEAAGRLATEALIRRLPELSLPESPEGRCYLYVARLGRTTRVCQGPGCRKELSGRQRRWCSKRCEMRARRQALAGGAQQPSCLKCAAPLQGRERKWCPPCAAEARREGAWKRRRAERRMARGVDLVRGGSANQAGLATSCTERAP